MHEVEAIAEELWRGRGGDHDTWGELALNDIKGENESLTEVGAKTVVWWGDEGEEVDEREGLGTGDCAVCVGDRKGEKDFVGHGCGDI